VVAARPVLDVLPPVTVLATPPQLTVERVEEICVEGAHRSHADERPDVLVRVPLVRRESASLERHQLEVLVEQLIDRCGGPRMPAFVDLAGEPTLAPRLIPRTRNKIDSGLVKRWGRWGSNPRPDGL
jgi:hypothetical protein